MPLRGGGDVRSCGIGEHGDFGFLTILSQNAPGLQVLSPLGGSGSTCPVVPDSFVVNGGCCISGVSHPMAW